MELEVHPTKDQSSGLAIRRQWPSPLRTNPASGAETKRATHHCGSYAGSDCQATRAGLPGGSPRNPASGLDPPGVTYVPMVATQAKKPGELLKF